MAVDTLHSFYRAFREDGSFLRIFNDRDADRFTSAMVALGKENGFEFEEKDVVEALQNPDFFLREALGDEELSDAELAVMAGGATVGEFTVQVPIITSTVIAATRKDGIEQLFQNVASHVPGTGGGGGGSSTGGTSSKG